MSVHHACRLCDLLMHILNLPLVHTFHREKRFPRARVFSWCAPSDWLFDLPCIHIDHRRTKCFHERFVCDVLLEFVGLPCIHINDRRAKGFHERFVCDSVSESLGLPCNRNDHKYTGGNENFRQTRIYNFRVKCVVFARNRKFAKSTQWNMQYIPCNSALLAQETLFLTQKGTFFAQRSPKSA